MGDIPRISGQLAIDGWVLYKGGKNSLETKPIVLLKITDPSS
jgi:hypothetical protein